MSQRNGIVVVDDSLSALKLLVQTLAVEGYQVRPSTTGEGALATIRTEPPELVLLDIRMPSVDGFEVCRQLKASESTRDIPILFLSATTDSEARVKGFALGAVDFISKPFQREELVARIRAHLDLSRLQTQLEEQVAARTGELRKANDQLRIELAERHRAEAEVRRLNAELEHRVIQRTAQLQAANTELEAFSYSVSHDLRAPLRTIIGFSGILMDECGQQMSADGVQAVRAISRKAAHMAHLIDDLLGFSLMRCKETHISEINMTAMAREVFEDLRGAVKNRQLHFELAALPPVQGDPAMMRQVWVNLLSNAVKYTTKKELALIEIGFRVEEGQHVYFVRDNGVGFDMARAQNLFGVFQRLHRQQDFEGTGVGLALVQRIIQRHGGWIQAEAKTNEGATFSFTVPGAKQDP